MSFISLVFLLGLPGVLLGSWMLRSRPRLQSLFLLAYGLFFYGYHDWRPVVLLAALILSNYVLGNLGWLWVGIALNLFAIVFFRWIGVSFIAFQAIAYLVDLRRGTAKPASSLLDYALFVAFFPHLVQGPIARAAALLPQIARAKCPTRIQMREGGWLLLYGLFQKIAIGDTLGRIADPVFDHAPAGWIASATGAVAYTLQIYGDFAGYSNIARGCAKMLGVEILENFRTPYLSVSIREFWRRWHISLSSWLRDYLYVPLGGNRRGLALTLANLMAVMLLGGLWHGIGWTFLAWGALHGLYLVADRILPPLPFPAFLKGLGVFILVAVAWIFFRSPSLPWALGHLSVMGTLRTGPWSPAHLLLLAATALFALPLELLSRKRGNDLGPLSWPWWMRAALYVLLFWSVFGGINGRRPFLYFQF